MIRPETLAEFDQLRRRARLLAAKAAAAAEGLQEVRLALCSCRADLERIASQGPRRADAALVKVVCGFAAVLIDAGDDARDLASIEGQLEAVAGQLRAAAQQN